MSVHYFKSIFTGRHIIQLSSKPNRSIEFVAGELTIDDDETANILRGTNEFKLGHIEELEEGAYLAKKKEPKKKHVIGSRSSRTQD